MHILTPLIRSMPALLPREDVSICQSITASRERHNHNLPPDFNTFHTIELFCSFSSSYGELRWERLLRAALFDEIVQDRFILCRFQPVGQSFNSILPLSSVCVTTYVIFRYNNISIPLVVMYNYLVIDSECVYPHSTCVEKKYSMRRQ